ncbi:YqiJ family protein [Altererythrobacter sp. KTW20L]|uniref:YqiJ family protein n=1 Tax=Altererythrobacter sp. KTW20L TaxID=2942210 RepID=UPI0020BEAF4B|nr:YqiJ family protein [Altererythrobacter sp. KTW20L]MCL6251768.1 YqiJ family protein [Altererythrobacter sp. KTW20L]
MDLLADHNLPFAIALGAMLLLSLIQIIGVSDLFSADVDADIDAGASFDGSTSLMGGITTLLGIGRVPFLVWLMVFLFLFAAIGLGIQELAENLTGGPLYNWLAALFSAGATLPTTAVLVRPLGRIMPQDETDAVHVETLVGRRAVITIGRAASGSPARARVLDFHGTTHHVMVEPHEAGSEIHEGEEVLLVRREGAVFFGMPLAERRLSPLD